MDIKFPQPQYLGAKYIHGDWIAGFIPEDARVILDAFSGSQSIGFLCKKMGKSVITNDFLKFNSEIYNTPRFSDRHNYGGMTRNRYICKKEENQNGKTI